MIVLKFGGTSVGKPERMKKIEIKAKKIKEKTEKGRSNKKKKGE